MKVAEVVREEEEKLETRVARTSDINRAVAKCSMMNSMDLAVEQVWFPARNEEDYSDMLFLEIKKLMKKYTGFASSLGSSLITGGGLYQKNRIDKLKAFLDALGKLFDSDKYREPGLWPWTVMITEDDDEAV